MIGKVYRLLVIEDNYRDIQLLKDSLDDLSDLVFEYEQAASLKETFNLLDQLNSHRFDVAIIDLGLLDSHGVDTFVKFHDRFPDLPCIVLTGADEEHIAKEVMSKGAHNYLVKGFFEIDDLVRSIRSSITKQNVRAKFFAN